MKIRDALESDLESLAELLLIVHRMHVKAQPGVYRDISHDAALDLLAPRLTQSEAYLRVAEIDSQLQGYCSAAIRSYPSIAVLQSAEFFYVNEIVVSPTSRRRGVGRALVVDLKEFARQVGVTRIEMDVGHFNSAARSFFQSQGFGIVRARMGIRINT